MSNPIFEILAFMQIMKNDYSYFDYDEEDIYFMDNQKVQDIIFQTYIDLIKLGAIKDVNEQESFIEIMANNFNSKIALLNEKEQEYVKKKISEVLYDKEDNQKKKELRKEND